MTLTQLIVDNGVGLNSIREFVGLTADEDRDVERPGYQGNLTGTNTRHDIAVGKETVSSNNHLGYLEGNN